MPNAITPLVVKYVPAAVLKGLRFIKDLLNNLSAASGGAFSKDGKGLGDGGQNGPSKRG